MHIHDEISRIADMDDISRVDLQGFVFSDLPAVTREMGFAGVETVVTQDVGSRLPGQSVDRIQQDKLNKLRMYMIHAAPKNYAAAKQLAKKWAAKNDEDPVMVAHALEAMKAKIDLPWEKGVNYTK